MLVDIRKLPGSEITEVRFKLKDLKKKEDYDDLTSIAYAVTTVHCFEPMELASGKFENFLKSLKPRITYAIQAGIADGQPFFAYGGVV
jgi:hypothetical protein